MAFIIPSHGSENRKRQRIIKRSAIEAEEPLLRSSDPEAKELLDLAIRVKQLKPWQWMEETDLIGIENPETREIGFISVMGSVGEYEAVALFTSELKVSMASLILRTTSSPPSIAWLNFLICKRPSRNENTWRNGTAI